MRAVLFDHMERYRLVSQKHRPLSTHKRREHELIRDAALCRRADEAGTLVRDHLQETTDTVLQYAHHFLAGDCTKLAFTDSLTIGRTELRGRGWQARELTGCR